MGKEVLSVDQEMMGRQLGNSLPLLCLNHVSYVCKSVQRSAQFYQQVLGFVLVQRPSSFDFKGAWLFNHGIGIHLLEAGTDDVPSDKKVGRINPKDNHISFQCSDMKVLIQQLEEMGVEYVKTVVREGGIVVDQIFFHDPDGYMIEICNCQNLPLLPLSSSCPLKTNVTTQAAAVPSSSFHGNLQQCSGKAKGNLLMDNMALQEI